MRKEKEYLGPTFTRIPNKALDALIERGASTYDIAAYVALCKHYNFSENKTWPSLNLIAKEINCSQRNVIRSIKFLIINAMIFKQKNKNPNRTYENNSYLMPHLVSFQIEYLALEKKTPKILKRLKELKDLESYISESIKELVSSDSQSLRSELRSLRSNSRSLRSDPHNKSSDAQAPGVVTGSPTNNTTINTTINITKNVKDTNDDLISGFKQLNRHKRSLSLATTQPIGEIDTLIRIKHEGLVQEIAKELNDEKSIPFFRKIVSKFANHEESIYKCLSLTRETDEISGINKSRGAVFTDHIKREAVQLGIVI